MQCRVKPVPEPLGGELFDDDDDRDVTVSSSFHDERPRLPIRIPFAALKTPSQDKVLAARLALALDQFVQAAEELNPAFGVWARQCREMGLTQLCSLRKIT